MIHLPSRDYPISRPLYSSFLPNVRPKQARFRCSQVCLIPPFTMRRQTYADLPPNSSYLHGNLRGYAVRRQHTAQAPLRHTSRFRATLPTHRETAKLTRESILSTSGALPILRGSLSHEGQSFVPRTNLPSHGTVYYSP